MLRRACAITILWQKAAALPNANSLFIIGAMTDELARPRFLRHSTATGD
jgi:hypothetical protein